MDRIKQNSLLIIFIVSFALSACHSSQSLPGSAFTAPVPFTNRQENQDIYLAIAELSQQITRNMLERGHRTAAIMDFCDLNGNATTLGRYISEELTTQLFKTGHFVLVERTMLHKLVAELRYSNTDLISSTCAKKFGRLSGADAIISGSLCDLGDRIRVNARVIDAETGEIFAAADGEIGKTPVIEKLMAHSQYEEFNEATPQAVSSQGSNLVKNGSFEQHWKAGWARHIGNEADGTNHVKIIRENNTGTVHLLHTGKAYLALVQVIPIQNSRLKFSGTFKLASSESGCGRSAMAMVEITYLDQYNKRLGCTRFVNHDFPAFLATSCPEQSISLRNSPTTHYLPLQSGKTLTQSLNIDEEVTSYLPGIKNSSIREIAIILYTGGANQSSSSQLWAQNIRLGYRNFTRESIRKLDFLNACRRMDRSGPLFPFAQ